MRAVVALTTEPSVPHRPPDPARATGLDGALRAVAAEPHPRWLLLVVATGPASFAVHLLARARHPVG